MADPKANAPLAAIDTNVLLELGNNCANTHNCLTRLHMIGVRVIVTPTVIQELVHGIEIWEGQLRGQWAQKALECLLEWGIQPGGLVPVGHGICDAFHATIVRYGYLPEAERNDALILAESSLWGCTWLVTWDRHLLEIPEVPLRGIMEDKDLKPVKVVSPNDMNQIRPAQVLK